MIKKRLIAELGDSKNYIVSCVLAQWLSMLANAVMIFAAANLLEKLLYRTHTRTDFMPAAFSALGAVAIRTLCALWQERAAFNASKTVRSRLRERIFKKLLSIGPAYKAKAPTAEAVQLCTEGVEQLETYFGAYLPQLFYSLLAPLTLFVALCFVSVRAAAVLLVCVPLIPAAIVAVQKIAKRLPGKYWDRYAKLGDSFLENVQGLTTLKVYSADELKNAEMNAEAENFRKIAMKVLTMQLNSVTVMDLIAYGGAALGAVAAASEFSKGRISYGGCFAIIMLSAEFFIPMRRLGSFFHVAMNGMAASDRMFALLDLPESEKVFGRVDPDHNGIKISDLRFSYDGEREVLGRINIEIRKNKVTAIVGESGSGKSTVAAILMGRVKGYEGSVKIGGTELGEISAESLAASITYLSHDSHIFKGTVRENLLMGNFCADDEDMWAVLKNARLYDFLKSEDGLETKLLENGANLSGGQRQRLALARALLHDSPIYIFDEATCSIDAESENEMIDMIYDLAKSKTVVLITHRLANAAGANRIYVLKEGRLCECGRHNYLLRYNGEYARMWYTRQKLENIGKGGVQAYE